MRPTPFTAVRCRSLDSVPSDLVGALNELPLFPLHQAVLFPGALMPLHVFESRYRKMIDDALASHRAICVAHVPNPGADMTGNPAIAEIAGVGTIIEHMELPGGRYNILLRGRARVRLQELHFEPPYRRALATVLSADDRPDAVFVAAMHSAASAFAGFVRERDASFEVNLPKDAPAGELADAYAQQLIVSPLDRQTVLETISCAARVQRVTEILTVQRATLAPPHDLN